MLSEGNCDWERTPTGVRCRRPGCSNKLKVAADYPLDRIHAACLALDPELRHLKEQRAKRPAGRNPALNPCRFQGDPTGITVKCGGCGGGMRELFACDIYATCLPLHQAPGIHCCLNCNEYEPDGGFTL